MDPRSIQVVEVGMGLACSNCVRPTAGIYPATDAGIGSE